MNQEITPQAMEARSQFYTELQKLFGHIPSENTPGISRADEIYNTYMCLENKENVSNEQSSVSEENLNPQEIAFQWIKSDLQRLIDHAKKYDIVFTVDIVSKQPLTMGNYDMIPDVRRKYVR